MDPLWGPEFPKFPESDFKNFGGLLMMMLS
jgi:hypothetical protein